VDDGDKGLEIVYTGRKNIYFVLGRLEQPRQNKNLLYRHDKPDELAKEGLFSFVHFEPPFTLVSTVSRGHHTQRYYNNLGRPLPFSMTGGKGVDKLLIISCDYRLSCNLFNFWKVESLKVSTGRIAFIDGDR
jgi:hypothetical protein